jgi:hypothetical protein
MIIDEIEEISVDIYEESGKIICKVGITPYGRLCSRKLRVSTKEVIELLTSKGYKFVSDTSFNQRIINYKLGRQNSGVWEFDLVTEEPASKKNPVTKPPPRPKSTPKKRSPRKRTSKNTNIKK